MTVAMITETDANPGETGYLASQLYAEGIKVMRAAGPEVTASKGPVRILVPFVATQVTAGVMDRLPQLGLIATRSTGTDHIDAAEGTRRGITIANVPDYGSVAVAEHAFALLPSLTRIQPHLAPGTDLSGKTLGVIGTGAIDLPMALPGSGRRSSRWNIGVRRRRQQPRITSHRHKVMPSSGQGTHAAELSRYGPGDSAGAGTVSAEGGTPFAERIAGGMNCSGVTAGIDPPSYPGLLLAHGSLRRFARPPGDRHRGSGRYCTIRPSTDAPDRTTRCHSDGMSLNWPSGFFTYGGGTRTISRSAVSRSAVK